MLIIITGTAPPPHPFCPSLVHAPPTYRRNRVRWVESSELLLSIHMGICLQLVVPCVDKGILARGRCSGKPGDGRMWVQEAGVVRSVAP